MTNDIHPLTVEGYASLFFETDLAGDLVLPGSFSLSLKNRGIAGVKMLFQHHAGEPVGVWDEIFEDEKGLFVRGRVFADGPRSRTAKSLLSRGSVDGLSIGFRTRNATKTAVGRELREIDLWEVSIVTFPMLPAARLRVAGQNRPEKVSKYGLVQAG